MRELNQPDRPPAGGFGHPTNRPQPATPPTEAERKAKKREELNQAFGGVKLKAALRS